MPRMAESELKLHSAVSSFGWFVLQSWEFKNSELRPESLKGGLHTIKSYYNYSYIIRAAPPMVLAVQRGGDHNLCSAFFFCDETVRRTAHRFINGAWRDDVSAQVALTADCRVTCFFCSNLSLDSNLSIISCTYHIYIAHTSPSGIFKWVWKDFPKKIHFPLCSVFFVRLSPHQQSERLCSENL